jgi:hypothetical protein
LIKKPQKSNLGGMFCMASVAPTAIVSDPAKELESKYIELLDSKNKTDRDQRNSLKSIRHLILKSGLPNTVIICFI